VTEIRFDVDLDHPPERVWRALTDPRHLSEWFLPVTVDPTDRTRLRLRPDRVDGFTGPVDVLVVDAEAPSRFVTRWQGDELHVRVAMTITPVGAGSRLTFVQRGFLGRRGTLRRRVLRATYGRMFGERLPPMLDRIAGQEPTVLIPAKVPSPPGNAGAASRSTSRSTPGRGNDGRFRGRRVRRFEMRVVGDQDGPAATVPTQPSTGDADRTADARQRAETVRQAMGTSHRGAGPAYQWAGFGRPAGESARGVAAVPGARGGATGRAAVPSVSAWLAAQPVGRRHRAVAVPYRRGGNTRSIRRFISVRSIADEPTHPLHAAGARRRRDVVSHSAGSPSRWLFAMFAAVGRDVGARTRAIPGWTAEGRSAAIVVSAALLLVMAVAAVVSARMVVPPRAAPPRVGGAAQPPPGFAAAPGRPSAADPSRPAASAVAEAPVGPAYPSNSTTGGPAALTAIYRTTSTWIGGYLGEVSIRNSGDTSVGGWTTTIMLPLLGLTVGSVHGAQFRQNGRVVTFAPADDTGAVPPHSVIRFDFTVDGVGQPTACTVDGRACAGVSG
jgi:uncharacterized protein YndB with AHSA1/START domain